MLIFTTTPISPRVFSHLINVFHLNPEQQLQQFIQAAVEVYNPDENVYCQPQNKLTDIKPFLGELTFALPALNKKMKIATQTLKLLDNRRRCEGHLEIGSTGRYIDSLEEGFNIVGEHYFLPKRR